MKPRRSSLVAQLTVRLGALVCVLLILFVAADYHAQKQEIFRSTLSRMAESARLLRLFLTEGKSPEEWEPAIRAYCHQMGQCGVTNHQLALVSRDGQLLSTTGNRAQLTVDEVALARRALRGEDVQTPAPLDGSPGKVAGVAVPLRVRGAAEPASALLYTEPLVEFDQLVHDLLVTRLALLAIFLCLILLVVFLVVRRKVSRPLNALYLHEVDVSRGILEPHDYPDPNNEISEIYDMFNEMVRRLGEHEERIFEAQKRTEHLKAIEEIEQHLSEPIKNVYQKLEVLMRSLPEPGPLRAAASDIRNEVGEMTRQFVRILRESGRTERVSAEEKRA